jgi:hypothetical protein
MRTMKDRAVPLRRRADGYGADRDTDILLPVPF